MKEEQVILVNEKDEQIGLCPKMKAHEDALLHRAFSIFVFNDQGKLLLQQRTSEKYHSPKLWTNTVCSHQRNGESNLAAGKRRLMEEMGMQTDLSEVFHFIYKAPFANGLTEHELDHVMIGFSNDYPVINPDEVMSYKWESLENIQADIANNPHEYTEWFKIIFKNSFEKLRNKLAEKMLEHPITFKTIYKEKPWGNQKLQKYFNKNIPFIKTGESWELSAVPNNISVVKDGYFQEKSLVELLKTYKEKLVGKHIYEAYGDNFPLLIKFIDASENLSIQVHPDDKIAQKKHNCLGKNEYWQVIQADKDAFLYIGFQEGITEIDYLEHLANNNLEKILNKIAVQPGDAFYIPAGTVHSIGKGVLLTEIQQSSDITYRIYDWNRTDLQGKTRALHTEDALEAIHFNAGVLKHLENLVTTPYFTIEKLHISKQKNINLQEIDSFIIIINIDTKPININRHPLIPGKVILLSATTQQLSMSANENVNILMVHL